MGSKRFEGWLECIIHTQRDEISCSECFDLVSGYVELEMSGGDPATKMPQVKQHLSQCPACLEEYETLHDLCHLEEKQGTLSVDDLRDLIQ